MQRFVPVKTLIRLGIRDTLDFLNCLISHGFTGGLIAFAMISEHTMKLKPAQLHETREKTVQWTGYGPDRVAAERQPAFQANRREPGVSEAQELLNQAGLMSLSSISPQHSQLHRSAMEAMEHGSARSDDSGAPSASACIMLKLTCTESGKPM
eukprot:symbB.v1.2.026666.t1/scaffold2686.1/size73053/6